MASLRVNTEGSLNLIPYISKHYKIVKNIKPISHYIKVAATIVVLAAAINMNIIKVYFSQWRNGVRCITYVDVSHFQYRLLLKHRLIADFEPIKQKIWFKEMNNIKQLQGMNGALFYTALKDGYLFREEQYALDKTITKMQEKHLVKTIFF